MEHTPHLLEVEHLTTRFRGGRGEMTAVDDVSWYVDRGEIVAIVGESGSGKTVSCLSILNLASQNGNATVSGSIRLEGRELAGLGPAEMQKVRGKEIGMVFQEPMTSLNPVFTVGDQLNETLRAHKNQTRAERKKRILELLELVGIPEPERRAKCYPHELSGGMKQRVMIAMALSCSPKVLIADEPTTALDVTIQAQVLNLLKRLRDRIGMSIVIVTHDLGVVANFAERVIVMYAGCIVEQGSTQAVLKDPKHWYTRGLLASIPRLSAPRGRELTVIPGNVPDISEIPKGCRFCTRCQHMQSRCNEARPPMTEFGGGHGAACWTYSPKEGGNP